MISIEDLYKKWQIVDKLLEKYILEEKLKKLLEEYKILHKST